MSSNCHQNAKKKKKKMLTIIKLKKKNQKIKNLHYLFHFTAAKDKLHPLQQCQGIFSWPLMEATPSTSFYIASMATEWTDEHYPNKFIKIKNKK